MAAHQAPPFLGFSRQEHWSGLPFPSQCVKVKSESEVTQSCQTLRDPMDHSLPGSSIHGIFQARVLEWGAIAFSEIYIYWFLNLYQVNTLPLNPRLKHITVYSTITSKANSWLKFSILKIKFLNTFCSQRNKNQNTILIILLSSWHLTKLSIHPSHCSG